jgi:hypothetical protein
LLRAGWPRHRNTVYEAAQARFKDKVRAPASARAKHNYLLAGMVPCCAGHGSRSMQGRSRKGHGYYT